MYSVNNIQPSKEFQVLTIDPWTNNIVRTRNGATIPIAKVTETDRFQALRILGLSETLASAVVKGLIIVPVTI